MPASATPLDRDIVVRQDRRDGRNVYVVPIASRGQYVFRRREDAAAQARLLAMRHGVRAWLSAEGDDRALLNDFRVMPSLVKPGKRASDRHAPTSGRSLRAPATQPAVVGQ
jgi:hypothetical protein